VQFVEMPYAEMGPALQQGRIAAACATEPFLSATKSVGAEIGNLSGAVGGAYLLAGWFGEDAWLQKNPEALRRFASAMQQAARWGNAHPKESAAILVRYTKINPDAIAGVTRAHYDEGDRVDVKYLQPIVDILAKYGKLTPFPAADLVWRPAP
jgi:NitT/TauT family transport system substrate-binding protein